MAQDPASTIIDAARSRPLSFAEFWQYRELLGFLVWRHIKVRYKQTAVGIAWAVIQPVATMAIFTILFGRLARMPVDDLPYPVFFLSGLVIWTYFAQSFQQATNILVDNQGLVTKIYFPRLFLPLSVVIAGLIDLFITFVVLFAILASYGFYPSRAAFWLPVFILFTALTAAAVGTWTSAANALYRDVKHAVPFLIQFWLFLSPVAYASSMIPETFRWAYFLNPLTGAIDGFRWAVTGTAPPPTGFVILSGLVVLALLIGGIYYFHRVQSTVADMV